MSDARVTIKEKDLPLYSGLDKHSRYEFIKEKLIDDSIRYGYGFYGVNSEPYQEDGKWYIDITIGNSCD